MRCHRCGWRVVWSVPPGHMVAVESFLMQEIEWFKKSQKPFKGSTTVEVQDMKESFALAA